MRFFLCATYRSRARPFFLFLIFFFCFFFCFYTWAPGGSGYGYRRLVPWRAPKLYRGKNDYGVVIDILTRYGDDDNNDDDELVA